MLSGQRSRTSTQNLAPKRRAIACAAPTKNKCGLDAMTISGAPNCLAIDPELDFSPVPKLKVVPETADTTLAVARRVQKPEIDALDPLRTRRAGLSVQVMKTGAHHHDRMAHLAPSVCEPERPPMSAQTRSARKRMQQPDVHRSHGRKAAVDNAASPIIKDIMELGPGNVRPRAPRSRASSAFQDRADEISS